MPSWERCQACERLAVSKVKCPIHNINLEPHTGIQCHYVGPWCVQLFILMCTWGATPFWDLPYLSPNGSGSVQIQDSTYHPDNCLHQ